MSNPVAALQQLHKNLSSVVMCQPQSLLLTLTTLLCRGHLLLEDVPGLGKTTLARALAKSVQVDMKRLQCTPDLMPSDITGVSVYNQSEHRFELIKGPVFTNLLLADEINRATPRTQSALLEAMAEGTVSLDRDIHTLPKVFMVIATQNPVEFSGTYPLPEAQLDRFVMHVVIDYPDSEAEQKILRLARGEAMQQQNRDDTKLSQEMVFSARQQVLNLHMSDAVEQYLVQLVMASRRPEPYGKDLASWIEYGASPRGTIALDRCARAHAWLNGRDYVSPDDVQAVAHDVLRHRLLLSFEAEASGMTVNKVINELLQRVPVV